MQVSTNPAPTKSNTGNPKLRQSNATPSCCLDGLLVKITAGTASKIPIDFCKSSDSWYNHIPAPIGITIDILEATEATPTPIFCVVFAVIKNTTINNKPMSKEIYQNSPIMYSLRPFSAGAVMKENVAAVQ